jgi:hypothetical protein
MKFIKENEIMPSTALRPRFTPTEYLALERKADVYDKVQLAMSNETPDPDPGSVPVVT